MYYNVSSTPSIRRSARNHRGLNAIAAEEQISLNALLLAAYFKLMNVWCHQDDMIINMPVFNREQ